MAKVLHGTLFGDPTWVSRGVFSISIWGLRKGVPLGAPLGAKNHEIFFVDFFNFFDGFRFLDV